MSLFNSDKDKQLWIKLNAERQIAWEKGLTWFNTETGKDEQTLQARNPRTIEEALEVSANQCEYDIKNGKLRFTLEELLLLDIDELNTIGDNRHKEWCKKFESL